MKPLCIVTGTSSGIGLAAARRLLDEGWEVVGVARRPASLEGVDYHHLSLDLSQPEAVQTYFEGEFLANSPFAHRPRVGLVNNAGVLSPTGSPETYRAEALSRAFNLNVVTPLWLTAYCCKHNPNAFVTAINISSGAAFQPMAGWQAYCATKAALRMAGQVFGEDAAKTESFRRRGSPAAVVNYSPGPTDTPMQGEVREISPDVFPNHNRFVELHQTGKLNDPEKVAGDITRILSRDDLPPYSEFKFGEV